MMTKEEEIIQFEKYKKTKNFNDLMPVFNSFKATIRIMCRSYYIQGYTTDDLQQELWVWCMQHVKDFIKSEWYGKIKFISVMKLRCQSRLQDLLRRQNTQKRGLGRVLSECDILSRENEDIGSLENSANYSSPFDFQSLEIWDILKKLTPFYDSLDNTSKIIFYEIFINVATYGDISELLGIPVGLVRSKSNVILVQMNTFLYRQYNIHKKFRARGKNLTLNQFDVIKNLYTSKTYTIQQLGRLFKISRLQIEYITTER